MTKVYLVSECDSGGMIDTVYVYGVFDSLELATKYIVENPQIRYSTVTELEINTICEKRIG